MDYLNILQTWHHNRLKKLLPLEGKLRASAILRNEYAGFRSAVDVGENQLSVIAQLTRTSPYEVSSGIGEESLSAAARRMIEGHIQGISLIVEEALFGARSNDLPVLSRMSPIPVLARGLWTHPVEICQAIVSGADAINLVAEILDNATLRDLYALATGLGLDVMVEVHSLQDVERALDLEADLICINHKNLHTGSINPDLTELLIDEIPASTVVLSAGGIDSIFQAQRLLEAGTNGLILGQALTQAHIPQDFIAQILDLRMSE